ncbi:hypothetical protein A9Q96_16965 [Rhodobacterales bacterium 52_120_T64]|nr:hypothetical protein A9Q96_16965 [Rhodobacterales bacterium 52_120_T64]
MARPITATAFAIDEIRRMIVERELPPGTELDQSRLAQKLDISRLPVRQALTHLAGQKFVQLRDHRSAIVAPISERDMRDLYALRQQLECWGYQPDITNITAEKLSKLDEINLRAQVIAEVEDHDAFMIVNREFHFCLYSIVKNSYVVDSLRDLFDLSERYQWMCTGAPGVMAASVSEHKNLTELIRQNDCAGFLKLSEAHNSKTTEWVIKHRRIDELR